MEIIGSQDFKKLRSNGNLIRIKDQNSSLPSCVIPIILFGMSKKSVLNVALRGL